MLFRFLLCRRGKQGEPVENASLSRMTFPMATVYGWAGCALHNSRGCYGLCDSSPTQSCARHSLNGCIQRPL